MGMSTHVIGFRPPDDQWQRMKEAWDACKAARIEPPDSVLRFFDGQEPDPAGVEVELDGTAAAEWSDDYRAGIEVDVTNLPPGLSIIRFYNSW